MITNIEINVKGHLEHLLKEGGLELRENFAIALRVPGDYVSLVMRYGSYEYKDVPTYLRARWQEFFHERKQMAEAKIAKLQKATHCFAQIHWMVDDVLCVEMKFSNQSDEGSPKDDEYTSLTIEAQLVK